MATSSKYKEPLLPLQSSSSNGRMRGGPRMGCSPYFVLTLLALLTFVTMRWWSLSAINDDLESRIRGLQHEILLEQDNIKKLDASLAQQRTLGSDLGREKSRLQAEADSLRERMEALQGERDTFATQAEDFRNDLQQWRERDVAATLNRNKQVEAANARVTALEGELAACRNKTAGLEEEAKDKRQSVVSTPKPEPAIIATKNESHVEESAAAVDDNAVKVEEEDVKKSQVDPGVRAAAQLSDVDPSAVRVENNERDEVDRRSALGNETQARESGAERGTSGEEGSEVKDDDADVISDIVREEDIKISGDEAADVDAAEADEKQVVPPPPPPPPGNDDSAVDDQGQDDPVDGGDLAQDDEEEEEDDPKV